MSHQDCRAKYETFRTNFLSEAQASLGSVEGDKLRGLLQNLEEGAGVRFDPSILGECGYEVLMRLWEDAMQQQEYQKAQAEYVYYKKIENWTSQFGEITPQNLDPLLFQLLDIHYRILEELSNPEMDYEKRFYAVFEYYRLLLESNRQRSIEETMVEAKVFHQRLGAGGFPIFEN